MASALSVEPLTSRAFAPFGVVIEAGAEAKSFLINEGTTRRFHALATLDVTDEGGSPILSIFRAQARQFPILLKMVERHPLGSQAFVPLDQSSPWLVAVATGDDQPSSADLRVFIARGDQGVQYAKGVWHHPLLSLRDQSDFLVADREGAGENLQEIFFEDGGVRLSQDMVETAIRKLEKK